MGDSFIELEGKLEEFLTINDLGLLLKREMKNIAIDLQEVQYQQKLENVNLIPLVREYSDSLCAVVASNSKLVLGHDIAESRINDLISMLIEKNVIYF